MFLARSRRESTARQKWLQRDSLWTDAGVGECIAGEKKERKHSVELAEGKSCEREEKEAL